MPTMKCVNVKIVAGRRIVNWFYIIKKAKNNQVQGPGAELFQTTDQKRISDPAARGNLGRLLKSSERSTYVRNYAELR